MGAAAAADTGGHVFFLLLWLPTRLFPLETTLLMEKSHFIIIIIIILIFW